jgi:hypothetical protein
LSLYQLAQLTFALLLAIVIAERVRALCVRGATSDEAMRWLLRSLDEGELDRPLAWARARPDSHVARVLAAALSAQPSELEVQECLADVREEASARLRMLRVCATLSSTTGLLGGILALSRNGPEGAGLEALKAGGAERASMAEAIATMAIGVATSALCFQALAVLRPAAQKAVSQAQQAARAAAAVARQR